MSGLAIGIDGASHNGALRANPHSTIAVLGNGLDTCYPQSHGKLFHSLLEKDCLIISEYEIGTPPLKPYFLERNRIIAGLSELVIVVQAATRSGTLRTAHAALEYGRTVASVPWDIWYERGVGCNRLIKAGAEVITNPFDVLDMLRLEKIDPKNDVQRLSNALSRGQKEALEQLGISGRLYIDDIKRSSGVSDIELTDLELQGVIERTHDDYFIKTPGRGLGLT